MFPFCDSWYIDIYIILFFFICLLIFWSFSWSFIFWCTIILILFFLYLFIVDNITFITIYSSWSTLAMFKQLSVRTKNKKEKVEGLFRSINRSTDEILLAATQKDVDDYFEKEKGFLLEYHTGIKDTTLKADKMTQAHKSKGPKTLSLGFSLTFFFIVIILFCIYTHTDINMYAFQFSKIITIVGF